MKKLIFCTAFMCLLSGAVSAAELEPKVVYDYSNNEVRVSADAGEEAKRVSLQVLNDGFDFDDLASTQEDIEKILYVKQADGVTGEFTFIVSYGEEKEAGLHNARLVVGDKSVDIENIKLISAEVFEAAVDKINEYAKNQNYSEFAEILYDECENLGFDAAVLESLKTEGCIKNFMMDVSDNPLSGTDSLANIKRFNTFMLMGALEDGVATNANALIADSLLAEEEIYKQYKELITSKEEQEFVTDKMSGKEYSSIEDLNEGLEEGILLNEIYYAEGFEDVQNILSQYGECAGITGEVSKTVARGLFGKEFDNVDELYEKYSEFKKSGSSSSSSSSSGGPSSAGGNKKPVVGSIIGETSQNTQAPVRKNAFTDIEGVDWAVESINALFDKGIINGRTEELFEPDEFVTREEFAKILVMALGYQNEAYGENVFRDVKDSDWFVSYVNIAYNKNLVKGVGNDNFGSGNLITRQDMAVMIYNALKSKGVECSVGDYTFSDEADLADYAKASVKSLHKMGIVNGVSETEFAPKGNATRAQAAKIVYGALSYIN